MPQTARLSRTWPAFSSDASKASPKAVEQENMPSILDKAIKFAREKFCVTGWKMLLYIGIFILLAWELFHCWGNYKTGTTSIFYVIHAPMHEVGHTVAGLLCSSETIILLAGSVFQILTPVAIGVYFFFRKDYPALSLCLGWLGLATSEMGAYMYDANIQQLTLVTPFMDASDIEGDFTQLFRKWNCLESGCLIGEITAIIGYALVILALLMIIAMLILGAQKTLATMKAKNTRRNETPGVEPFP